MSSRGYKFRMRQAHELISTSSKLSITWAIQKHGEEKRDNNLIYIRPTLRTSYTQNVYSCKPCRVGWRSVLVSIDRIMSRDHAGISFPSPSLLMPGFAKCPQCGDQSFLSSLVSIGLRVSSESLPILNLLAVPNSYLTQLWHSTELSFDNVEHYQIPYAIPVRLRI